MRVPLILSNLGPIRELKVFTLSLMRGVSNFPFWAERLCGVSCETGTTVFHV